MTTIPSDPAPRPKRKPAKRTGKQLPILDVRKQTEICAILAVGCPRARAAAYVGCAPKTITNTARRDQEFGTAMRKAEAQQEVSLLARIQAATKKTDGWRAAAWLLQRLYPERYARRPDAMTREQIGTVLTQFAEILTQGIRDPKDRRKVGRNLMLLVTTLTGEGEGEQIR